MQILRIVFAGFIISISLFQSSEVFSADDSVNPLPSCANHFKSLAAWPVPEYVTPRDKKKYIEVFDAIAVALSRAEEPAVKDDYIVVEAMRSIFQQRLAVELFGKWFDHLAAEIAMRSSGEWILEKADTDSFAPERIARGPAAYFNLRNSKSLIIKQVRVGPYAHPVRIFPL